MAGKIKKYIYSGRHTIWVDGKKRETKDVFEADSTSQEIKNLVREKYVKEVV